MAPQDAVPHNLSLSARVVLAMITHGSGVTRRDIAAATGMSFSAISTVVGHLRDSGLVEESVISPTGSTAKAGRRATILHPARPGRHAVDLGDKTLG